LTKTGVASLLMFWTTTTQSLLMSWKRLSRIGVFLLSKHAVSTSRMRSTTTSSWRNHMSEPKEVTVKIKCEDELVIKQKFLVYEDINVSCMDPILRGLVDDARGTYKGGIESIKVSITLEIV
jgi:hypothetical protein